jgi:hypothetical protein
MELASTNGITPVLENEPDWFEWHLIKPYPIATDTAWVEITWEDRESFWLGLDNSSVRGHSFEDGSPIDGGNFMIRLIVQ